MGSSDVHGEVRLREELLSAVSPVALEDPLVVRLVFLWFVRCLLSLSLRANGGATEPCPEDRHVRQQKVFSNCARREQLVDDAIELVPPSGLVEGFRKPPEVISKLFCIRCGLVVDFALGSHAVGCFLLVQFGVFEDRCQYLDVLLWFARPPLVHSEPADRKLRG